jgi:CheY-like chemotaxis protein
MPEGRNLHLLVVEDDERVLAATVAGIHELGHRATACNNPLLAIELLKENPPHRGGFDLVLTDVLMPNLTGPELAKQIHDIWPALPIIFVTGYAGEATELETAVREDVLRKPYSLAALDQAIRRHMDRSTPKMRAMS